MFLSIGSLVGISTRDEAVGVSYLGVEYYHTLSAFSAINNERNQTGSSGARPLVIAVNKRGKAIMNPI